MRKLALMLWLALLAGAAQAQQQLEIIKLQSRTADQVLPQLRPFIEPGGTLSGMNNQIFIRASDANRRQIKELLAAIDRPPAPSPRTNSPPTPRRRATRRSSGAPAGRCGMA